MKPIGIVHTPFKEQEGTPIQPTAAMESSGHQASGGHYHIPLSVTSKTAGQVEVFTEFAGGLKDLEGFERVILLFYFHKTCSEKLLVHPYLDTENPHGIFATRAPCRPNRIGISCVRLVKIEDNILHIEDVDILDGTPLLDIKPYVPQFDSFEKVKTGWIGGAEVKGVKADSRFK